MTMKKASDILNYGMQTTNLNKDTQIEVRQRRVLITGKKLVPHSRLLLQKLTIKYKPKNRKNGNN